jgi:hypothetical protein
MKTLLTISCLTLACAVARAGDPNTTAPVVDTTSAAAATGYTPKTKSVFTATVDQHNPFWPIGWVKTAEESSASDSVAAVIPHAEDFNVTTIMLNEPPMAVINGKDMAEGEIAALPVGSQNVVVQLMAVQDGRVILRWENQNIVVPIHRDEDLSNAVTAQNGN